MRAPKSTLLSGPRGAVHGRSHDSEKARSKGLLWVGVIDGGRKEMLQVNRQYLQLFDLEADPEELKNMASHDRKLRMPSSPA